MELWQAVVLGIVQGVAEFIPISSSGHLVVLQKLFDIEMPGITFDIVLHLGSLAAIFMVFWRDIAALIRKPFQKMNGLLIVGTLPVVLAGFLLRGHLERLFHHAYVLAILFVVTGLMLIVADKLKPGEKTENDITYADAAVVGCMQALGLPPGISRSGATITGALGRGIDRQVAAKFSFLLAIIAIAGAGFLEAVEVAREPEVAGYFEALPLVFGFLASLMASFLAIKLLLKLIGACKLRYFSYYLFALAAWMMLDIFVLNIFF